MNLHLDRVELREIGFDVNEAFIETLTVRRDTVRVS